MFAFARAGLAAALVVFACLPAGTADESKRTLFFAPDGPGFLRLTMTDAKGSADGVVVRIQ
jgi:penicillin-binding protein 1C